MNSGQTKESVIRTSIKVLAALAVLTVGFGVLVPDSSLFRPFKERAERKQIYAKAKTRVEAAGGWQAIEAAISTNSFEVVSNWEIHAAAVIPATMKVLRPKRVWLSATKEGLPILHLQLFGGHRTGSFDSPHYEIIVLCTNAPADFIPLIDWHSHGMMGEIQRKGNFIFEVR